MYACDVAPPAFLAAVIMHVEKVSNALREKEKHLDVESFTSVEQRHKKL